MWVSILRSVHNTRWQVAALSRGHISLRVYRSGDKLKQQVEATDHYSVCTGRATSCSNKSRRLITPCSWVTSCSNKSRRLITPCVQVGRQVAATSRGDWSLRAVERQVAATSRGHWSLCVYRSGDKLQQQVEATDHSVCTGRATSCSNTLRRHIAATNRFVCTGEFLGKSLSPQQNFVTAISRKNSVWFDFLRHVSAIKFCCGDEDFHTKKSIADEAICRWEVSPRHVAAI